MGCDIHVMVEKKIGRKWVGVCKVGDYEVRPKAEFVDFEDATERKPYGGTNHHTHLSYTVCGRNYNFFARLAGVRGDGPAAKGLPEDVSEWTRYVVDGWGSDGHSHTWYSLREFTAIYYTDERFQEFAINKLEGKTDTLDKACEELWGIDPETHNLDDYRVVFWFDN